jgi:small subunit ribosomal protein S4
MGFASDHAEARQLVRHGHFTINGKKVNIPSYLVRARDVVQVKEASQKIVRINEALAAVDRRGVPQWITLDKENFRGAINQLPSREDVTLPIREQLIIELYSK